MLTDFESYFKSAITVDNVILGFDGLDLNVLLIKRGEIPFINHWALPGHFIKPNEVLISSDNIEFVVCTEWSLENIQSILKIAKSKGFEIQEIKKNSI